MGTYYYHHLVPAAEAWDFLPSASQLAAILEVLQRHRWIREGATLRGSARCREGAELELRTTLGWGLGGDLEVVTRTAGRRLRRVLRQEPLREFLEGLGDLREQRIELTFEQALDPDFDDDGSPEAAFPDGVINPQIFDRVRLEVTPLLTVFGDPDGGGPVKVECPECRGSLCLRADSGFWPGAWSGDSPYGIPRGCPECRRATDPGALVGTSRHGHDDQAAPFFRFQIAVDTGKSHPGDEVAETDAGLLDDLCAAAGVSFRATRTVG